MLLQGNKKILLGIAIYAAIFGLSFPLFSEYDYLSNPDIGTYIGLAEGNLDQSPVRRYRLLVPFLAKALDLSLGFLFDFLAPWEFPHPDFSLCFSFFLVNSLFLCLACLMLVRLIKKDFISPIAIIIALLVVLTSRWTPYIAGLPLVDSFYFLVVVMTLITILERQKRWTVLLIFFGPWAKESFFLFFPLIFFFGPLPRMHSLSIMLLALGTFIGGRYLLDIWMGFPIDESYLKDIGHLHRVRESLNRLFSFHGVYEIFSIAGFWIVFPILVGKKILIESFCKMPKVSLWFLILVLLHALLSTELGRMLFLAIPIYFIFMANIFNAIQVKLFSAD